MSFYMVLFVFFEVDLENAPIQNKKKQNAIDN